MTTTEYRQHPALNFSLAKHLLKSPAHFKAAQDEEREETEAMRLGTLAHAMILEGKDLRDLYAIKPEGMSFATKEGKAWRDAQTLPIISGESAASIPRMAEAVKDNAHAAAILRGCQNREMPIVGNMFGVDCKALIDLSGTDGAQWVIADLKTCQDSSQRAFGKQVAAMDYDLQAAWYSTLLATVHGLEEPPFWIWIAVEKTAPFVSRIYTAEEWMDSGMEKLEKVLTTFKECTAKGKWPMPYGGMVALDRPAWA